MKRFINACRANSNYLYFLLFVAVLAILPMNLSRFSLYNLNIIAIYAIVAVGLNILTGFTGQVSLCHAAFFAIGGYAYIILMTKFNLNFFLCFLSSGIITSLSGLIVSIPALRLLGIYLAIATMGFGFIVVQLILEMGWLTGGTNGISIGPLTIFSFVIDSDRKYFYLIYLVAIIMVIIARNLIHSNTGRSFKALMDSEVSAATSGVHVAKYKIIAFLISSFYAGIAGALYAQYQGFISPENYNISQSIDFIVMIVIGGIGTTYGGIVGAAFVTFLPEVLTTAKSFFPALLNEKVEFMFFSIVYGIILLIFILYIPSGIFGGISKYYKSRVLQLKTTK